MDEFDKKFGNIVINQCNLCKLKNNINSNFCISCQSILTKHFIDCKCIYCR